jgi:hypothetical protein
MSMIRQPILTISQNSFCHIFLPICSNLADDRKLGYGFTSTDELEEIDIGPRDKPWPIFISKKLDLSLREPTIALLKESLIVLPGITRRSLDWTEASSNIGSLSRKDCGHFSNERVK